MFPYFRKRDQPREEVCLPGLIEVIRTQPRLWDAVGIRHRGQAALPHWVTRPEATRVGSLREFRERGHSVPFQVTSDKGTAPRERLELHQEDLGWRPGKGLGHSPKLPELQERLENALKDRVGLSGGDFHAGMNSTEQTHSRVTMSGLGAARALLSLIHTWFGPGQFCQGIISSFLSRMGMSRAPGTPARTGLAQLPERW